MAKFALIIAPVGLYLYRVGGRTAVAQPGLAGETSPAALLARYTHPGDRLSLYTDLPEESYARSELPRMWSARMRDQLLTRRLVQQYPDHTYRSALVIGASLREPARLASLLGLMSHPSVEAACDAAASRGLRVAGMWPISLMLARSAARRGDRHAFLLTAQLPSGLRHVLVDHGMAVFSRLSQAVPDGAIADLVADAQRTAQYLAVQGWRRPTDDVLASRIWHVASLQAQTELPASVSGIDLQELRAAPDIYAMALSRPPPDYGQLLPASATLTWRAASAGQGAVAASGAVLLAALAWGGVTELRTNTITREAIATNEQANAADAQTQRILATAKGNLGQAGLAQASVAAWTRLVKQQPDYTAALRSLAAVLVEHPQIKLDALAWRAGPVLPGPGAVVVPSPDTQSTGCAPQAQPVAGAGAPAADPSVATGPTPSDLTLRLVAQLPSALQLRERVQEQDRFVAGLKQLGWRVELTRAVVDQGIQAVYAGVIGQTTKASFELCISVAGK
ncbi:MAG: hypothetical protein LCH79_02150 [Proteobacteria bacterium]|nr:hypothetical protein [Pseudomonadota bacterium]